MGSIDQWENMVYKRTEKCKDNESEIWKYVSHNLNRCIQMYLTEMCTFGNVYLTFFFFTLIIRVAKKTQEKSSVKDLSQNCTDYIPLYSQWP